MMQRARWMEACRKHSVSAPLHAQGHGVPSQLALRWVCVLMSVLVALPAFAHREHNLGQIFHDVSLTEARKLAADECRIVLVYVVGPEDSVPGYLLRPTWEDWRTLELLLWETIPVALHSLRDADELRPYDVRELPAVLLLNADGTERRRFPGGCSAEQLAQRVAADLQGADTVERARRALEQSEERDPYARERLADSLARAGEPAEALKHYLWCLDVGLRENIRYARARRQMLFECVVLLAQQYAPARAALRERQASVEESLRSGQDDANLARDWATLNLCLDDEQRSLSLFDELPPRSRARHILFDYLLPRLVQERRYKDVLDRIDPLRVFEQEVVFARIRRGVLADSPRAREVRGTRAYAVSRGAALLEALAATGRLEDARPLADRILDFHDTPESRALLTQHLERVAADELLAHIKARAAKTQEAPP